jgi:hypothetical protein
VFKNGKQIVLTDDSSVALTNACKDKQLIRLHKEMMGFDTEKSNYLDNEDEKNGVTTPDNK